MEFSEVYSFLSDATAARTIAVTTARRAATIAVTTARCATIAARRLASLHAASPVDSLRRAMMMPSREDDLGVFFSVLSVLLFFSRRAPQ